MKIFLSFSTYRLEIPIKTENKNNEITTITNHTREQPDLQ